MADSPESTADGGDLAIAIVVARDHADVTRRLLRGAQDALGRHGVEEPDVYRVPTTFELPVTTLALAEKGGHDAIVCLGAVIRDDTGLVDTIVTQAAAGIMQVQLDTGVPVTLGILIADDVDQALAHSGQKNNRGAVAAEAAIEIANLLSEIQG